MDREQNRVENKIRKLMALAGKEKSLTQLYLLMPVMKAWLELVRDDRSHSKWYWEEVEKRIDKEYSLERYEVNKPQGEVINMNKEASELLSKLSEADIAIKEGRIEPAEPVFERLKKGRKKQEPKSKIMEVVQETVQGMYDAGTVNEETLKKFEKLTKKPRTRKKKM